MKKKLLHIMMGQHNPDLKRGLDTIFDCLHFDWTIYSNDKYRLQLELLRVAREFKPDIVFMHTQCDVINKETLMKIKNEEKD